MTCKRVPSALTQEGTIPAEIRLCEILDTKDRLNPNLAGAGPRDAIARLELTLRDSAVRSEWLKQAHLTAMLGSCPRTMASVKSGVRRFCQFARVVGKDLGSELPPTETVSLCSRLSS